MNTQQRYGPVNTCYPQANCLAEEYKNKTVKRGSADRWKRISNPQEREDKNAQKNKNQNKKKAGPKARFYTYIKCWS